MQGDHFFGGVGNQALTKLDFMITGSISSGSNSIFDDDVSFNKKNEHIVLWPEKVSAQMSSSLSNTNENADIQQRH